MTRRERIEAALARKPTDRTPFAVWRHFPEDDPNPRALARATLAFQARFGSDFLKVTFAGGYAVADWGCVEADRVEPDGHRPCARHAVAARGDWKKIRALDPREGEYGRALEAVGRVLDGLRDDVPVVATVFSPLSLARKLSGERLNEDLRERPGDVEAAIAAIAETEERFAALCLDRGAAGIFYSIQAGSRRHHTVEEYLRVGEPHDRRILESLRGRSALTILHAHGADLHFDRLSALPAGAVNWEDRATPPSLAEGLAMVPGAVIGGLDQWKTLRQGSPAAVRAEVEDAIAQTGGRGLILGPGCVLPLDVPDANIDLVAAAAAGAG